MKGLSVIWAVVLSLTVFAGVVAADEEKKGGNIDTYAAIFYGEIDRTPEKRQEGIWVINGREVLVTSDTRIEEEHGRAEAGAYVAVTGDYADKTFVAYQIEVKLDNK